MKNKKSNLTNNDEKNLPIESRILFQNSACIVVNKLSGEAVHSAGKGIVDLPYELAKFLHMKDELPQAAHRLDVPVTGCSLFALNKPALAFLNSVFAEKTKLPIEKYYWAIIEKPATIRLPESGELIHFIEANSANNKSFAYNEPSAGRKKAALHYKITGSGNNYLFMEITLLSGRHHQIRAQLAAEGLHIKGDLKYGAKRSEKAGGIRLHARSLSFPNPLNETEKITVTANPPIIDNLWEAFMNC